LQTEILILRRQLNLLWRNTGGTWQDADSELGRRDTFLVDTFAELAARYGVQTVSTHH
jgi:hypothetical protein